MMFVGPVSSLFDYATFALMWFFYGCMVYKAPGASAEAKNHAMHLFQTGWFVRIAP